MVSFSRDKGRKERSETRKLGVKYKLVPTKASYLCNETYAGVVAGLAVDSPDALFIPFVPKQICMGGRGYAVGSPTRVCPPVGVGHR